MNSPRKKSEKKSTHDFFKKLKCQGICLTKQLKDLYYKSYRILREETEEDTKNGKTPSVPGWERGGEKGGKGTANTARQQTLILREYS